MAGKGKEGGKDHHAPIIVKKKKHGDHDEHGGAWKIAYADFVTAMMAFFLLMWLVNATNPDQKKGIAEYFNPVAISKELSGTDGLLAGRVADRTGALTSPGAVGTANNPFSAAPTIASVGQDYQEPAAMARRAPRDGESPAAAKDPEGGKDQGKGPAEIAREGGPRQSQGEDDEKAMAAEATDRQRLKEVREDLLEQVSTAVDIKQLAEHLIIEDTPEGLRIQIVDRPSFSMFAVGSANLVPEARRLLQAIGRAASSVPNRIAVSGHTDALQYAAGAAYTNWELSSDRANAARRELVGSGVDLKRLVRVEGFADADHLVKDRPTDPRNRRISVVLLREKQTTPAR